MPKLVFEAVRVAAREIIGLLDDPVALEPATEWAELGVQPLDLRAESFANWSKRS